MNEKQNDICPKCARLLDSEGLCWYCMTNKNTKPKLAYGVYNDITKKKPVNEIRNPHTNTNIK